MDYGRKYRGETGANPIHRQTMGDIYSQRKPELPQEIKDQITYAASLGEKKGFKVQRGLGTPVTSQEWFVAKPFRRTFDLAPGCSNKGFKTLEEAIVCFENLI